MIKHRNAKSSTEAFAVYQRFNRAVDMNLTVDVLRDQAIPVRVSGEDAGEWREARIIGSPLQPKFWIEIPAHQFEKANYILQDYAEATLSDEDLDQHPFADYSERELKQVLLEETDWSPDAVVVARKLLLRAGTDIDLQQLRRENRERLAAAYQPVVGSRWLILLAALAACFAAAGLWLLIFLATTGVLLYYTLGTQRDHRGVQHYLFDRDTRSYGSLALSCVAIALVAGVLNAFYYHWFQLPAIDVWYWLWL